MQVEYPVLGKGKVSIEVPGINDAFQFLAQAETVFGVDRCGNCESQNLALKFKTPKGYEYYSVQCKDCGYEYTFGQTLDDKKLFPNGFKKNGADWSPPFKREGDGNHDNVNQDHETAPAQSNGKANRGF